jgi:protein-tyrosine phosphatase
MIDVHCHILPGIDDGPSGWRKALEMGRLAAAEGFVECVATPHYHTGLYQPNIATIQDRVTRLNMLFDRYGLSLLVWVGMEVALTPEVPWLLEKGKILTMKGSRYLLVEIPRFAEPETAEQILFQLIMKGISPVLAHPERHPMVQERTSDLLDWVRNGVLIQVDAQSLTGGFGRRGRACARFLLEHRAAHILATDAHSRIKRPPRISQAVAVAEDVLQSSQEARAMVSSTPRRLLANKGYSPPEPLAPSSPQRSWKRFLPFMNAREP